MIFSKQHLERAFNYVTPYFNKILLVNFNIDSFVPIKVMDTEWSQVVDKSSFTKWVKEFANSPMYKEINDPILYFADLEKMKELNKPKIILYEKIVNGEFHLVQLETQLQKHLQILFRPTCLLMIFSQWHYPCF